MRRSAHAFIGFIGAFSFDTNHPPASVFIILGAVIAVVWVVLYFVMGIGGEDDYWYGDPSNHYYGSPGGWGNGFGPFGGCTHL